MKKLFFSAIVAFTLIGTASSCKKEEALEKSPTKGNMAKMTFAGDNDQTDLLVYPDDGPKVIELNEDGTCIIRTNNSVKTFYSFKRTKLDDTRYNITFDESDVIVNEESMSLFPSTITWKTVTKTSESGSQQSGSTYKAFSATEFDGIYEFKRNENRCSLTQTSGKHAVPAIIEYIVK